MFVLAVCVATLSLGDPAPPRDTTPATLEKPSTDTVRVPRTARPSSDTLPIRKELPASSDSARARGEPRRGWRKLSDVPDTLRAYIDAGALDVGAPARAPSVQGVPARRDVTGDAVAVSASTDAAPARRRKKVVDVEYGDWYNRRLTIHRWASYATLPLFAGNYVTGTQLFEYGNQAPAWAIRAHGPLATSVASLFAVNTLTGGWNLMAGAQDPNGRAWRVTHALLMLGADAGFTAAGVLSSQAERSDQRRRLHRTVALTSVGVAAVSYVMMIPPFRRD